ncbi:coproporphyrinogen III oxidase [Gautieria morchelliformis]|nr:coproporphyrinogen III oxidase [Gautieria morchelliformis]
MQHQVKSYISILQARIIAALESLDTSADGARFLNDSWKRPEGGYGQSSVLSGGTHIEKAGVNISVVHGKLPPPAIKQMRADHEGLPWSEGSTASLPFFAAGLSLVIHPNRPEAPTVHANYRYFEITEEVAQAEPNETEEAGEEKKPPKILAWWFGGGSDLTPSYLFPSDAQHFHGTLKAACDPYGDAVYHAFKKWCDEYFYIPHRNETRGIGGIFFDDLTENDHKRLQGGRPKKRDDIWAFVRSCGDAFIPSYIPILQRRIAPGEGIEKPLEESEERKRRWQLLRRGRYVEFNLVYDRGTKFGLMTPGARIESILMSLPETARWEYCSDMGNEEGTREKELVDVLKTPRDWA